MDIDIEALPGPTEEQLKALDPNEVNLEAGDWSYLCLSFTVAEFIFEPVCDPGG